MEEEEKKKELEKEEINPEDIEEEDSISEQFAKTIAQKRDNMFRKANKTT